MEDLLGPLSLCSCNSPKFEKRTLYCGEYEDSVMTCSLCLQELSINEWDQRQNSSSTRTLKVDNDKTLPIYTRRQSSEGYFTDTALPAYRPSPVPAPGVLTSRSEQKEVVYDDCDMTYMNDILSFAPCSKCGQPKTSVTGSDGESPIAWFCGTCDDYTGVDDTFSIQDAHDLAHLLANSLKNGTLHVDLCKGCGENSNPELFTCKKVDGEIVMECMSCNHREPLLCADINISEPTAKCDEEDTGQLGLRCECGNDISEVFQVKCITKDKYEVRCLNCDRKSEFVVNSPGKPCDQEEDYYYVTKRDVAGMDPLFSPFDSKSDKNVQISTAYTKVKNMSQLKTGDHIKFERDLAFWHHAIVESVDRKKKQIDVIHYSASKIRGHLGQIMQETISVNFKKDSLHRVDYKHCHSWDTVLLRAHSRIGEVKYNPFTNNCEHFTQWCKIGVSRSDQVQSFADFAIAAAAKVASFAAKDGVKQIISAVKSAGKTGLRKAAEETVSSISASSKVVAKNIASSFTKIDAAMTGVAIVMESISAGVDIGGYYKQKKGGEISGREFIRCTVKRVCQGAGGIIGSVLGNVIGNFTIPIVGGVIGATLGALIGEGVGRILGRQVSKLVRD